MDQSEITTLCKTFCDIGIQAQGTFRDIGIQAKEKKKNYRSSSSQTSDMYITAAHLALEDQIKKPRNGT